MEPRASGEQLNSALKVISERPDRNYRPFRGILGKDAPNGYS